MMTKQETKIELPTQSVLLVTGKAAILAAFNPEIDGVPIKAINWDVNRPDESHDLYVDALEERRPLLVKMIRSHPKARRRIASTALAKGAVPKALRLIGSEDYQADEKFEDIIDLPENADLALASVPMPFDLSHLTDPIDFIGDIHGCADELLDLLVDTGHANPDTRRPQAHPEGRRVVFLGDLTDRGPKNLETLQIVREMESFGALRVLGNHDDKLARWMIGRKVSLHGSITDTIAELQHLSGEELVELGEWVGSAQHHLILDGGRVIAAHAGIDEEHQGRATNGAKAMALYGKIAGKCEETGFSILADWAADYGGEAVVVHGHVVYPELNNVVAIDTGCVFGGKLTAYHWPERTFSYAPARATYYTPEGSLRDRREGHENELITLS